ncbi:MAG: SDR family NAD(P)-dependent oxidoreductase, partial [Clostridiales bacterium]|nr:SDR family NAD(P)-dependent oxidoreductase [Clostridiales bacterium]
MTVLVTGGAGFIGSHTVVELLSSGYDVIVVDNYSNSKPCVNDRVRKITGRDFKVFECEMCDAAALDAVFDENHIDAVIHFAGLKAVGESVAQPARYYRNNLLSTLNLIDSMKKHGVGTIVFSSSATVYGSPKTVPIREDFPLSTTNPYGET